MNDSNLPYKIKEKQDNYYSKNSKRNIFKNSQKIMCAEEINKEFRFMDLINATIYQIPNTNKVYFDYLIFKSFAIQPIYETIIQHILDLFDAVISKFSRFEVHMNLDTFSMSAAQRYNEIIQLFCNKCLFAETRYANFMDKFYIYNAPTIMRNMSTLFSSMINENVKRRVELIDKKDSVPRMSELMLLRNAFAQLHNDKIEIEK
jgi:hypothetical protein